MKSLDRNGTQAIQRRFDRRKNNILVGFVANTCIEGTARFGMELGYHVTLIKDATAAFEQEGMHAAHEVNGPRFAHAILTTDEMLALLPASHSRNENEEAHR